MRSINQIPEAETFKKKVFNFETPGSYNEAELQSFVTDGGLMRRFQSDEALQKLPVPEIKNAKILSGADWKELTEDPSFSTLLSQPHGKSTLADVLRRAVNLGNPNVLTYVGDQAEGKGTLNPLLKPEELRTLPDSERNDLLEEMRENPNAEYHLAYGPSALVRSSEVRESQFAADEALVRDIRFKSGEVVNKPLQIVSPEKSGQISSVNEVDTSGSEIAHTALFNVADYPRSAEVNPQALVVALKGKNISPHAITAIAQQAGVKGAFGFHMISGSDQSSFRAIHHLPDTEISAGELVDPVEQEYMNALGSKGAHVTAGTRSHKEGYSLYGHGHTINAGGNLGGGHFSLINEGEAIVVIVPAEKEMIAEYK